MDAILHTTVYSIEELRSMIVVNEEGVGYEPLLSPSGKPIFQDDCDCFRGEVFRIDPETKAEGSNFGRVRMDGVILKQYPKAGKADDWLCVDIQKYGKGIHVWRVIAGAWCQKREGANIVNHINNNGFDNRPANLLWVNQTEHSAIEKGIFNKRVN
jgi:hypothetical protein